MYDGRMGHEANILCATLRRLGVVSQLALGLSACGGTRLDAPVQRAAGTEAEQVSSIDSGVAWFGSGPAFMQAEGAFQPVVAGHARMVRTRGGLTSAAAATPSYVLRVFDHGAMVRVRSKADRGAPCEGASVTELARGPSGEVVAHEDELLAVDVSNEGAQPLFGFLAALHGGVEIERLLDVRGLAPGTSSRVCARADADGRLVTLAFVESRAPTGTGIPETVPIPAGGPRSVAPPALALRALLRLADEAAFDAGLTGSPTTGVRLRVLPAGAAVEPTASVAERIRDGIVRSEAERPLALVYAFVEGRLVVTAVDRMARVRSVPTDADAEALRAAVLTTRARMEPGAGEADAAASSALLDVLVPPPLRAEVSASTHLVVLPTAEIGAVPFLALTMPGEDGPMVTRRSVTVAPSLRALVSATGSSPAPTVPALVFGVGTLDSAAYGREPSVQGDAELASAIEALPLLVGARSEAERVAQTLGVVASVDERATREDFFRMAVGAPVLHVAAHGIASARDPIGRGMMLLHDGPLRAGEVAGLPLVARVAVLSACQSALGRATEGGVIGLARAFHYAGVGSVVASLWRVPDAPTARMMADFHVALLREGSTVAGALREAAEAERRRGSAPGVWAAFVAFGRPGT